MSGVRTFGNGSLWSIYNSDCAFTWLRLAFVCVRLCFESIFVLLVKLNPILVWIRTTRSIVMHDLYPNSYIPFNRIFIRDCNHSTLRLIYITHILTNNLNRIKMKPQQHKQIAGIQFKPVRISLLLLSFFSNVFSSKYCVENPESDSVRTCRQRLWRRLESWWWLHLVVPCDNKYAHREQI